ncbi:Hypothetical protein (Fragment) [Durusdinium trenchii]|uniref:Uncharacterized protein n=2 Tax=Durusdinium trenchii TaxID=1381693 RepID=A0ABP0JU15_9DINO
MRLLVGWPIAVWGFTTPEVLRPPDVDCDDREEWSTFRTAAQRHAQLGWPSQNAELEAMSRALVRKWRWVVCKEDCQTTSHLSWFFVEDWGARCVESVNFDRYLVTHYFRNRGLVYTQRLPSDYCHFGFITALVVMAHFEFPNSVAQAGRLLFLAFVLLGDFFVFDWLYSSSWPVDSLLIMLNVYMVTQGLTTGRPLELLRESAWRPGVDGPAFLRQHSRWSGTSEEWKPRRPAAGSTLRIWQIDSHTALAGEAKTMLTRFGETIGAEVSFQGNSFGGNVCQNYGLCPSAEEKEILQGLLDQYYKHKQAFASVAKSFENVMGPRLSREADVLMCGQPLYWCRFLLGLQKPVFFYVGLPVMWDAREEDWEDWAADFAEILLSERHTVIAMSVLTARIIHWQFGTRIPVVRFLGLHTRALYAPVRNDSVLVSRFGTSGALSECMFDRFAAINQHWFPLRFVQMEWVLFDDYMVRTQNVELENAKTWKEHTREIKVPHMPYQKLTSHRAAVCLPYDTTIFLFNELYGANMPIFVPKDLWRWLIGPHTLRQMEFLHHPSHANSTEPPPELSPFFASIHQPLGVEQALEWSSYSDWALLPHVFYFQGIPELFKQLMDMEALLTASAAMKAFNDEELIFAVEHWRKVAQRRRRGGHGLRSRAALRLEGRRADWGHRTSMDGLGRFDVSRASALMVGGSHCW